MCCIESKIQVGSNCTDSPATARSVSHPPSQDQQHEAYRLQNHPLRTGTLWGPFLGALSKAVYPRCGSRKRGGDRRGTGHQARGPRCSTDFTPSSVGSHRGDHFPEIPWGDAWTRRAWRMGAAGLHTETMVLPPGWWPQRRRGVRGGQWMEKQDRAEGDRVSPPTLGQGRRFGAEINPKS